jgi:hypothetical protein
MRNFVAALGLASLGLAMPGFSANAESIMKMCGDQWEAAKAAGASNGETWPQFLAKCRAHQQSSGGSAGTGVGGGTGTVCIVGARAGAVASAGAAVTRLTAHCQRQWKTASSRLTSRHVLTVRPIPWFGSIRRSRVYHFVGTHNYGHTKEGAYMCEAEARAAGDKAAMNEHHP